MRDFERGRLNGCVMILIVDDDTKLGALLEKVFRFDGLEAVNVSSGMEALSLLHIRKPQLIMVDLAMPLMDGMTLLEAVRADPDYKSVPIVIYTSDFSRISQDKAFAMGAQDYFIKGTVGWQALLHRVHELIDAPASTLRIVQ
jgi:PleD family two-component response regulator